MADVHFLPTTPIENGPGRQSYFFYWVFVPYMTIFLAVLFFAYRRVFVAEGNTFMSPTIIAFIFVLFIYFLVCHAGVSLCRLYFKPNSRSSDSRLLDRVKFWLWLALLLIFSAYGVFSSLLLYIDGPVIMRESISDAKEQLQLLEDSARKILAHPLWDDRERAIRAAEQQLHNALLPTVSDLSYHYCGIGEQAQQAVSTLTALLPGFQITRGDDVDHDCRHQQYFISLQRKYDNIVNGLLAVHPMKDQQQVEERNNLLKSLLIQLESDRQLSSEMLARLQSVSTFFPDLTLYYESTKLYSDISQHYRDIYTKLLAYADANSIPVEPTLASPAVEQIASPWRTPDVVIARANRATTWIFLLIAVVADVAASLLAANLVYVLLVRRAYFAFSKSTRRVAGREVEYIWRPDPRPGNPG